MFKRRSIRIFSSPKSPRSPDISSPTGFVKVSGMGPMVGLEDDTSGGAVADYISSKPIDGDGAKGESLVQEEAQLDISMNDPQTPSPAKPIDHPLKSHPITTSSHADGAPPPPDFTPRGIHIPTRTSSSGKTVTRRRVIRSVSTPTQSTRTQSGPTTPRSYSRAGSSAESFLSYETESTAPSTATQILPVPLQPKTHSDDRLSPLLEDDPRSFDLAAPDSNELNNFSLETRAEELFSSEHLQAIFQDTASLLQFTSFLSQNRPDSVPILIYYLDALKALRAINYANAVAEALEPLEGHDFTQHPPRPTLNAILEDKAKRAFDVLVQNDLPAFVTHVFIQVVAVDVKRRITGCLPEDMKEGGEGLAEVFCLTDPSRVDNPIIFASEEFHRTTQYGVSSAIGRNCRFLQGPRTNPHTVERLRKAVKEGKEFNEVLLNYRRDGSPFMNLLMLAPLLDSQGNLRYYLGAQIDVSGLVKSGTDLEAFRRMLDKKESEVRRKRKQRVGREGSEKENDDPKDEFQELCEMFNNAELDTVRKFGGSMHRELLSSSDNNQRSRHRQRNREHQPSSSDENEPPETSPPAVKSIGQLSNVYKHYLLLRPSPSLRILFTSPSLRVPGILQSRFLDRIGGSPRIRDSLAEALASGKRGVTAKIRWLTRSAAHARQTLPSEEDGRSVSPEEGRPRWIHCTPLLGAHGEVGVWMVILIDIDISDPQNQDRSLSNSNSDSSSTSESIRGFRRAPPVEQDVRRSLFVPAVENGKGSGGCGRERDAWSDDEFESGKRGNRYSPRLARSPVPRRRRPQSVVGEQRAGRTGSPGSRPVSGMSFALY